MQLMSYAKNYLKMDKIDRLLDTIEHPERYTQTEIETMLRDPEVKETFDLLDKAKSSIRTIVIPDVEEEWKRFGNKHSNPAMRRSGWLRGIFSRNAAASIAVGVASFTAVAAVIGAGIYHLNNRATAMQDVEVITETGCVISQPDTIKSVVGLNDPVPEIVVFDNESLETILTGIADYYGCNVIFNNDASKSLRLYFRWDRTLSMAETVERLNNFEQIRLTLKGTTIKAD